MTENKSNHNNKKKRKLITVVGERMLKLIIVRLDAKKNYTSPCLAETHKEKDRRCKCSKCVRIWWLHDPRTSEYRKPIIELMIVKVWLIIDLNINAMFMTWDCYNALYCA